MGRKKKVSSLLQLSNWTEKGTSCDFANMQRDSWQWLSCGQLSCVAGSGCAVVGMLLLQALQHSASTYQQRPNSASPG